MRKRKILTLIFLPLLSFYLFYCADSATKLQSGYGSTRIEYSLCKGTSCLRCLNEFHCPQNAISTDSRTHINTIDTDKCTNCRRCIDTFQCPYGAIGTVKDLIGPGEIRNLSMTSPADGVLQITFTAPGDDGDTGIANRYEFSILDDAGNPMPFSTEGYDYSLPSPAGVEEFWWFEGLAPDTQYTLKIRAWDEADHCDSLRTQVAVISGTLPDTTPPAAITDLNAVSGEESITLTWTAPGDDAQRGSVVSYDIRYSISEITMASWDAAIALTNTPLPQMPGAEEHFEVSGLTESTTWYFAVEALDEAGNRSPVSNSESAQVTGDLTPPAAITDLYASSSSTESMALTWTAPGDNGSTGQADHYIVKYSLSAITADNWDGATTFAQTTQPQIAGSTETLIVTGLSPATLYYTAVKAVDDTGNSSGVSNSPSAVTATVPDTTPPSVVMDLAAVSILGGVNLEWTAPGDDGDEGYAAYYVIKQSTSPITEANFADATSLTGLPTPAQSGTMQTLPVNGLTAGTTYYFALRAVDDAGNSSTMSNLATGAPESDTTPPDAVSDLAVAVGTTTNVHTIKITWTAPGDDGNRVDHYEVRWADTAITADTWATATVFATPPAPVNPGSAQNCSVTGLVEGVQHYFAVVAYDASGNVSTVSNSPVGRTVYQISTACRNCNNCINTCPNDAIYQATGRKQIHTELCDACGTCEPHCPWNAIRPNTVAN
jgi:Fe-S-cluster-containing hydrogenase component 2/chitodextrinase